jgi:hypothetical protein
MANKVAVTEASVFAAADGLKAQGVEPTYDGIVHILGGGSNSTIKPHLINWKQMAAGTSRPVPEPVQARAKVLAAAIWGIAFEEAQAEFDRAKQLTDAEVDRSQRALSTSITISEQHEKRCHDFELQLEATKSDCLEARVKLRQVDELKLELAQAREVAEECRRQCELMAREIATLKGENNALRDQGELLLARVASVTPRSRAASARGRSGKSTS